MKRIIILDTTLRDGDQAPGMAMTPDDKLAVALMLESAGVDIIEAGFPASSQRDFEAVRLIAAAIKNSFVCAMARALEKDIEKAAEAVKGAANGFIHLSLATSPIHRKEKLRMSKDEVIKNAVNAVKYAKHRCSLVEIGAEDATRTEPEFLRDFYIAATEAGADVINIADTSGYALPEGFAVLTRYIAGSVPRILSGQARISVHCHNDLGLALANTLAGISAGASQAEVTLMGIGERAGNAALEELAAVMKVRNDGFAGYETGLVPSLLLPACELLSSMEALAPCVTKPLAGRNTFSHSSGIHQDGVLKYRRSYEIIDPVDFGGRGTEILLSRHSGRNGVASKARELLGFYPSSDIMENVMREYDRISGDVKSVSCTALLNILKQSGIYDGVIYRMLNVSVTHERGEKHPNYSARVDLKVNETKCPAISAENTDPFKALFTALDNAMPWGIRIKNYSCGFFGSGDRLSVNAAIQAEAAGRLIRAESYRHDIYTAMTEAYVDIANYAAAIFRTHMQETPEYASVKE
jgi:2-isopropylmalate synthase